MKLFDRLRRQRSDDSLHKVTVDLDAPDAVRVVCTTCGFVRAYLADKQQGTEIAAAHMRETLLSGNKYLRKAASKG